MVPGAGPGASPEVEPGAGSGCAGPGSARRVGPSGVSAKAAGEASSVISSDLASLRTGYSLGRYRASDSLTFLVHSFFTCSRRAASSASMYTLTAWSSYGCANCASASWYAAMYSSFFLISGGMGAS